MGTKLYTVAQVADLLQVSIRTVRRHIREGRLVAVNVGGDSRPSYRVTDDALDEFVANRALV